ncbi:MAG TPA: hypothetical protein DCZ10_10635 [Pelotomaculum sp.]|nr:hypothetical protein [Pelotomaculum sp.]
MEVSYGVFFFCCQHLQTLVIALGAGVAVWGVGNLLEGYGSDNPAAMRRVHKEADTKYNNTR